MALLQRTGIYGTYWGDETNSSHTLSYARMQVNATYIYSYMIDHGWSVESISAMLGNMQSESAINPGRWEGNNVGTGPGYGLVQWTPYTKYTNWCADMGYTDYSQMDYNLDRIEYEIANGLQWISTSSYPMSFTEFKTSTGSPYDLAMAFLYNYERPASLNQPSRGTQAESWYTYLTGQTPTPPGPGPGPGPSPGVITKRKRYNFVLFDRRRRVRYGRQR